MLVADLIAPVRTHLKGAPDPTVTLYLRRAAKQFCQDSAIWTVNLGSAPVAPPDTEEELRIAVPSTRFVLPEQSYLNAIAQVRIDRDTVDGAEYRYDLPTATLILEPGTVQRDSTLYVDAVLETADNATEIPDFIARRWSEGIADYAIAEMLMMPEQEWSNPMLAAAFKAKYDARLAEATVSKARGGSKRRIRLTPIPFV